jgi:UDP:flavonoid glycosyltransferase YjiC (YdhE family)
MWSVRIVVSFVGGWGHAEPLLPLAALAERRGHRVSFAGQGGLRERLTRLGYAVDVVGPDTLATTPQPITAIDRAAEQAVMSDQFIGRFARARAASLGELFDREQAEVIVCDEVDVGAVVAAEQRGIRCVSVNVIAAGLLTSPDVIGSTWDELRRDHGLDPDPDAQRIGGDLTIAPLPRTFRSPAVRTPPAMRFVRPPILDDVRHVPEHRSEYQRVYMTLGTVFNLESGDLLSRLVHAANSLADRGGVDVAVTVGPHVRATTLPTPRPNVRVESFVPQRELLAGCHAVVCHAGSGTLLAALSLGIPVVVLPMGADQLDNAERCVELGVGIALDPLTASSHDIADAVNTVLSDARFSARTAPLAVQATTQPHLEHDPELRKLFATPTESPLT